MFKLNEREKKMNDSIYTVTQKQYLKAESLNDLKKVFGNQIVALTSMNLNNLSVYKELNQKGFLSSLFNKSDAENKICTEIAIRSIAVLLNSFRSILYDGITKHATENLYKEIVSYIGGKLPDDTKLSVKDKNAFMRDLYREVSQHTEPKSNDSVKKDMHYLSEVNPKHFNQSEMMKLQKFITDGWVPLYPHTFVTQFKKLYNQK